MVVDLRSMSPCPRFAGPYLAPWNVWFSYENPSILALLLGVDLGSMSPCPRFAGPYLAPWNVWFSYEIHTIWLS